MNLIDRDSLLEKIQFRIEPFGVVGATIKDCVEKTREIILAEPIVKDINVPSWIPVTERLPKEDNFLAVTKGGLVGEAFIMQGEIYWQEDAVEWDDAEPITERVAHWMPLPEPPKEV